MHTARGIADRLDPTFYESALDSLMAHVAVVDSQGEILAVNDAWVQSVDLHDLKFKDYGVGCNYLAFCDRLETAGGAAVAAGLRGLIAGSPGPFRHEYAL